MTLLNTTQEARSTAELSALGAFELLALFGELDAPSIEEMHGDYDATLLQQPSALAEVNGFFSVGIPFMSWQSKGFRPVDESAGRGYNSFRNFGRIVQRYPMITLIAPSRYDRRPSYTLVYRAHHSTCGLINMVDEVRRVDNGQYLGIGTWGFSKRQRQIPLPFSLTDVGRPYIGDIESPRAGFQPGPREIPALASAHLAADPRRSGS